MQKKRERNIDREREREGERERAKTRLQSQNRKRGQDSNLVLEIEYNPSVANQQPLANLHDVTFKNLSEIEKKISVWIYRDISILSLFFSPLGAKSPRSPNHRYYTVGFILCRKF